MNYLIDDTIIRHENQPNKAFTDRSKRMILHSFYCHVSNYLIDFILYSCCSDWFRMEIDFVTRFVTHCLVVIFY
jgi:hypothetical protein